MVSLNLIVLVMQVNINSVTKIEVYANQVHFSLVAGNGGPFVSSYSLKKCL